MKVNILREDIKKGISIVGRATSKSFTLPVLSNILISAEKNFLKLSATNLEIGIKYWILAKIEKEGKLLVPAKTINSLISFIDTPQVEILGDKKDLLLQTKNYKTKIKGLNPEDFPIIPKVENDKYVEVLNKTLVESLDQVVESASLSNTRPEISGILFKFEKDSLKIVGTDSFRLAEKTITLKQGIENASFILPQRTARELSGILSENPEKNLKIYISNSQVIFENEMEETEHPLLQIVSRLIEGEFPNYQEIIPQEFKTEIVIKKDDFMREIKKASVFVNKINEVRFRVSPDNNSLEIVAQNPEVGNSRSIIKGEIKGVKMEASFNYKFLLNGLSSIKTPELKFLLTSEEGPAIMRPVGKEDFFYIVMPIKSA